MKLKSFAKHAVALAVLAGAAVSANAATYHLGMATPAEDLVFKGIILSPGPFSDLYTFTLPANGGSSYSVIDVAIPAAPGLFKTLFSSIAVFSNPDGILFNGDDVGLDAAAVIGSDPALLSLGPTAAGSYYLTFSGITTGAVGGLYEGTISVTAVPEPESYAMLLAGLGVMGAIAVRRNKAKKQD